MQQLNIEYLNPSELKDYELNSKLHPQEQIEKLAREIKEVGFRVAIVVDNDGVIVQGHGRKQAAILAGLETVPVHRLPADIPPDRIRAMRLFDNKIAESGMDQKLLRQELSELVSLDGFDFSWTGFAENEIVDVLPEDNDWVKERDEKKAQEDERADSVPELAEQNPRGVVRGQVWKLGRHRLMCGDSTSETDAAILMDGAKADLVFTDPPYGVSFQSNMRKGASRFDVLKNDDVILDVAPVVWASMSEDSAAFIWTAQQVYPQWREQFASFYKSTVIWAKGGGGMGDLQGDFAPNYEIALFCVKGRPQFREGRPGAVWEIGKDRGSDYVHPTQKPVALAEFAIKVLAPDGGSVLDLFGGSGSTLIACEKTGRTCFMMELDEHYCSVIIQRFEDFTGQKAELLTSP